ncbi:ABA4-like family protein [Candidatus Pelagibacter sp.]|nr:ABA4-like family protein [Candidatus Pelagibacter sp.]
MIEQIYTYFTIEILYFWVNLGVLPFWLILIFFPSSNINKFFVTSILPILLLSGAYIFALYKSYLNTYDFISNFELYLSISNLSNLFSNNLFLILFWIHFVSINLFIGGWMVRDSQKLLINKILVSFPLIITYLIGPLGVLIYWLIRIFYAKSIRLYD